MLLTIFRNVFKKLTQATHVLLRRNVRVVSELEQQFEKEHFSVCNLSVYNICSGRRSSQINLNCIGGLFSNYVTGETDYICLTFILVCFVI